MPRQPLDAREDVMKERPRQVAFGELQREVPSVPDQPPAGLEQPLLKAREGPILDGDRENEPAQQVAEVIGDDAEEQPHLVGPEAVTGEPSPVGRGLALLDPLLGRAALVTVTPRPPVQRRLTVAPRSRRIKARATGTGGV